MNANQMMSERTLVLLKPDAVMRALVGEILRRFERTGLTIVGLKMLQADRKTLDKHFPTDDDWIRGMGEKSLSTYKQYGIDPLEVLGTADAFEIGSRIKEWNYAYLTLGPIVAVVLQGVHAIDVVRKVIGHTLPYLAAAGTVRGDYAINSPAIANLASSAVKNVVHASANPAEAEVEISTWFAAEELVEWHRPDEYLMFLASTSAHNNETV